jgi:UPF0148 protein
MTARKDDEIMAEYLLKGGKMLEKCCKTCGCPLFEYKKKTFCVVCAENEAQSAELKPAAATPKPAHHEEEVPAGHECTCGDSEEGSMLADELAGTILVLCQRIRDEKDPENCQVLMNSVKTGCEALSILCQL